MYLAVVFGLSLLLVTPALGENQPPPRVVSYCRALINSKAPFVRFMVQLNATDDRIHTRNESAWERSVVAHMIKSMRSAPTMTEEEIHAVGYTYCVERKP